MYHNSHENPDHVVFVKSDHETGHSFYRVKPEYPENIVMPSIDDLLFNPDEFLLEKWNILKWIVDADEMLEHVDLYKISKKYLADVLVLVVLVKVHQIFNYFLIY